MFTWLNKQGVKSNKGFVVQSINRFTIEYREANKLINVSVERALLPSGKAAVYIYPEEFEIWGDGTPIASDKQKEILQNFKDAMRFQGVEVLTD